MLQGNVWALSQSHTEARGMGTDETLRRGAATRFHRARLAAQIGRFLSSPLGRTSRLLHLGSVVDKAHRHGARHAGVRSVSIRQIKGSESRSDDFDAHFRPLKTHNRDRWMGIAAAWRRDVVLPPVELIQVGDVYFVRDGHHRISVARNFGQEQIDAEVTVWDVTRHATPATPFPHRLEMTGR